MTSWAGSPFSLPLLISSSRLSASSTHAMAISSTALPTGSWKLESGRSMSFARDSSGRRSASFSICFKVCDMP